MSKPAGHTPAPLRAVAWIARVLALGAGAAVAGLALLICIDIGARSMLRVSVQGSDEIGGYVLAMVGSLGLAHTLLQKGHPRVDLGFRLIPRILHAPLHVLALVTITAMALFMTVQAWGELGKSLTFGAVTNTPLQTPLWVPQGLWVAGFAFFALTAGLAALHGLILMIRAPGRVAVLYGNASVEEEVAAYIAPTVEEEAR